MMILSVISESISIKLSFLTVPDLFLPNGFFLCPFFIFNALVNGAYRRYMALPRIGDGSGTRRLERRRSHVRTGVADRFPKGFPLWAPCVKKKCTAFFVYTCIVPPRTHDFAVNTYYCAQILTSTYILRKATSFFLGSTAKLRLRCS